VGDPLEPPGRDIFIGGFGCGCATSLAILIAVLILLFLTGM